MSIPVSAELAASVRRMVARTWLDEDAVAFERGAASTRPARAAQRPMDPSASRFKPRQRPRSPDRKASRDRRRMLGGSSAVPPQLRHCYTEGQRAVLCIVAGEVGRRGVCDLSIDKIAALAGVCRTTVQTTLHEAKRLGHVRITERPQPGRKHLPNVVEIISAEWRVWLKRGPSSHRPIGSSSVNLVSTTRRTVPNNESRASAETPEGAFQGVPRAPLRPPQPSQKA